MIATNTIAQGDTRSSGLRWICTHGGTIYHARRRMKWPGLAAVVVSVIHIQKRDDTLAATRRVAVAERGNTPAVPALRSEESASRPSFLLDGKPVDRITAYLFHAGGHDDPARLAANAGKSFQGSIVLGMGFTFDDTDKSGVANTLSLMHELISKDPRNAERIFPYIGGEEVNNDPEQKHHRYVINFGDMDEGEARDWPALVRIIEEKVKPERIALPPKNSWNQSVASKWWLFGAARRELATFTAKVDKVLLRSRIGNAFAFAFVPSRVVTNEKTVAFALNTFGGFAVIQSTVHELWARFFSSTLKDDMQYTPSDCFETFPFPRDFESDATLEAVGKEYYEFRAALMIRNDEGLTKTYNRFHDPNERTPDILKLRELHAAMDAAVLRAYGPPFSELVVPPCDFFLDYEADEDEEETVGKRQKKKPWRFRWPDEFRDSVLALLLELNKERAALEGAAPKAKKPRKAKKAAEGDGELFG